MRGLALLIAMLAALVLACDQPAEESAATQARDTAPASQAENPPALPDDQAGEAEGDSEGFAELETTEDGEKRWKVVEVPADWPVELPPYEDARVIFREHAVFDRATQNHIIMESLTPEVEVGEFYQDQFDSLGWERLENSRGRGFVNLTYLWDGLIVDVNAKHVPEETEVEAEEAESVTSDFEGTVIKIHCIPGGSLDHFKGAIAWYSIDDVPDEFPLDLVPRYPGGEVLMVSCAAGDHAVLQQSTEDPDMTAAIKFYTDFYNRQGLEAEVSEDNDELHLAEFKGDGFFVRLSVVNNLENTGQIFVDAYRQETAGE